MTTSRTKTRFLLVVALLTLPSICFGWLFLAQSQKAITFAETELAGVQYLEATVPLFLAIDSADTSSGRDALLAFEATRSRLDQRFASALLSQAVVNAFAQKPINPDAMRYALLSLINGVSDESNLTIDPELDSFYLMQSMVFETPRLMASVDSLANRMALRQAVPAELNEKSTSIFVETTRLEDVAADLRQTYVRALASNGDGSLERRLSTPVEAAMRAIHKMSISGHRLRAAYLSGGNAEAAGITPSDGVQEKQEMLRAWSAMSENLVRLISQRLEALKNSRNLALTFSTVAGVVVFFLGLGVFRALLVELDRKINFLAHHDAMTELKNRVSFSEAIEVAIARHTDMGTRFAIHAVDLDGFKTINDTVGHLAGDQVLQTIAGRLLALAGPDDIIGRRGGDEFVLLQMRADSPAAVEHFAERIVKAIHAPMLVDEAPVSVSASVGSCIFADHGRTEPKLMQSADLALYAAKGAGKNRACLFNETMLSEQRNKYDLEVRVREAVKTEQFSLAYQPQYDTSGLNITGFEALLRLDDGNGKPISPVVFIPVLERLGLIGEIGQWVLRQAAATARQWPPEIIVAVNVSPLQFETGQLVDGIAGALAVSGLPPERLQIEITESAVLEDTEVVLDQVNAIKAIGVSVAMDDFGTGYSSLSSLWRFPFDKIKIDKSFLADTSMRGDYAINTIQSIVALAHSLSMTVTVEGVETQEQALKMAELKCDQLQGFYFSKPIPEKDLPPFILKSMMETRAISLDERPQRARRSK